MKWAKVPPELWVKIIKELRRPLPPPTGDNERSAIRQPHVAKVMRVCKLFNNLAAPFLYHTIIVDHLPTLLYGIDRPAGADGIESKAELLRYMKRLFLEYGDESWQPTYEDILRGSHHFDIIGGGKTDKAKAVALRNAERDWIQEGLKQLGTCLQGGKSSSKLRTLSICVFLHPQDDRWRDFTDFEEMTAYDRHPVIKLVRHVRVTSVCQSTTSGPLACCAPLARQFATADPCMTWNTHSHMHDNDLLPAITGGQTTWFMNMKPADYACSSAVIQFIARQIAVSCALRDRLCRIVPPILSEDPHCRKLDLRIAVPKAFLSALQGSSSSWDRRLKVVLKRIKARLQGIFIFFELEFDYVQALQDEICLELLEHARPCAACDRAYQ